ncbi:MAG: DeoR/GlpR transcriptional regulator [Clostridia bacterium]|nr:DeoR/GlpR transcriptional regulator [Clostridia bacterium]
MLTLERQTEILEQLKIKKSMTVSALAKKLFVSEATIRRDLSEMEKLGLIHRAHGGAVIAETQLGEVSMTVRKDRKQKEKQVISNLLTSIIKKPESIFLDASSTAQFATKNLDFKYSTVVTTGINTAINLSKLEDVNVILLGGTVSYNSESVTGLMAVEQIKNFNFNTAIISTCGVDNDFFSTEKTLEQALVKKEVLKRAKTKILLIDSSKFSTFGTHKVVSLDDYDYIVTDKMPSKEIIEYLSNSKTKILHQ